MRVPRKDRRLNEFIQVVSHCLPTHFTPACSVSRGGGGDTFILGTHAYMNLDLFDTKNTK